MKARFHYGSAATQLNLATINHSPAHSSIGTTSSTIPTQSVRMRDSVCLLANSFRFYFTGSSTLLFHLSLTVLVRYRFCLVFSLGPWSALLQKGVCRLPTYFGTLYPDFYFQIRGFHSLWLLFPKHSSNKSRGMLRSTTPHRSEVWTNPCSLVAY